MEYGSDDLQCCWHCFYNFRDSPNVPSRCQHRNKMQIIWNESQEFYETTLVREPPENLSEKAWGNVRLCDPRRKTCRRRRCTFAHGSAEQDVWNEFLRKQRKKRLPLEKPLRQVHYISHRQPQPSQRGRRFVQRPSFQTLGSFPPSLVQSVIDLSECKPYSTKAIKSTLTRSNYKEKFENLVLCEEETHATILSEKCNSQCNIYFNRRFDWVNSVDTSNVIIGYIEGLDLDKIAYVVQASDCAFIMSSSCNNIKMSLLRENFQHCVEKLYVAVPQTHLHKILPPNKVLRNVPVGFKIKQNYFNGLIKAVEKIKKEIIHKILPIGNDFLPPQKCSLPCKPESLDESQYNALKLILESNPRSPPILINGSFGTGKTRLLAAVSCALLEQKPSNLKILICAHHPTTLEILINDYFVPERQNQHVPFNLVYVSHRNDSKYSKYSKQPWNIDEIKRYQGAVVVLTTFTTSPSMIYSIGNEYFTHIFIDEGAQVREPEAISPLCLASINTKVVIAGDKCQVGPALLVLGDEAREHGLKQSLLERLHSHYSELGEKAQEHTVELKTNYRCSGEIMKVPNQLFYGGNITACPVNAAPHPCFKYPLVFVCSSLTKNVDYELEAKILLRIVHEKIVCDWPMVWGKKDIHKIGLIAPSRPQMVQIRHLARKIYRNDMKLANFLTTYTIQGVELQAVFISTSEFLQLNGESKNPTKSPSDRYVFNTVLTRSRSLVVAVGSPQQLLQTEALVKEPGNHCWSEYMKECLRNNSLIVPEKVERNEESIQRFKNNLRRQLGLVESQPVGVSHKVVDKKMTQQEGAKNNSKYPQNNSRSVSEQFSVERSEQHSKESSNQPVLASDFPPYTQLTKKQLKKIKTEQPVLSVVKKNAPFSRRCSDWYSEHKDKLESEDILGNQLTPDNYKEMFHQLLCWEELEHDKLLSEKCDGKYIVTIYNSHFKPSGISGWRENTCVRFGHIDSDNGDILSYAKQASEGSFLVFGNNKIHVKHVFAFPKQYASFSAITIGFEKEELTRLKTIRNITIECSFSCEIEFELKHSYFGGLHDHLENIPKHVVDKLNPLQHELCLPTERDRYYRSPEPLHEDLSLDELQKKALHVILNASNRLPILVAGPFGTGKTRLLARAAYDILRKKSSCVLVCAHHQTSVDTFAEIFGKIIEYDPPTWHDQVVRIVPNGSYRSKVHTEYKYLFKSTGSVDKTFLKRCRLVITTFRTAPTLLLKLSKSAFFSDILIDEGAQSREPETLGPLCLAGKSTRIVIAGDHCQVGPRLLVLGEKAQKHGLATSLLERLHNIYEEAELPINTYSVTLLTNYRCHNGILMLPSSLFYQSTLQCRVPDSKSHPDAPFPLSFVCSSIEEQENSIQGTNIEEIEVLLKEVQKYFKEWPRNWDENDNRVCIMSPSANQCSEIREKLRSMKNSVNCSIEVRKAYDIQGTEFKAIFVSTSEPVSEEGEIVSQTKSITDKYVFNTAITRSRYLVVAVGNPFLLMKLEDQMSKKYGNNARCWSSYMKQCIECQTFSYSQKLQNNFNKSKSEKLINCIYETSTPPKSPVSLKSMDSIIKSYKKHFERGKKLMLCYSKGKISWNLGDDIPDYYENEENKFTSSTSYDCVLDVKHIRLAKAIPLDSSKPMVTILGMENRKNAFDGDVVKVDVFEDCGQGECYGKVRELIEERSNRKFICEVSSKNPIEFFPVDKKNPKLTNLPRIYMRNQDEVKQNSNVVVFELPREIQRNDEDYEDKEELTLPIVKQVIPFQVAKKLLFLVSFVTWKQKYRNPLGIVEAVLPKGFTRFNAERLLTFQHCVDYNDERLDGKSDDDFFIPSVPLENETENGTGNLQCFTIDPEGAKNLDDALSIRKIIGPNGIVTYQVGVHIVNAAKGILAGSEDDIAAKALGVSVYGGYGTRTEGKVRHMISSHALRLKLSLIPGKNREVISVIGSIKFDPKSNTLTVLSVKIEQTQIRSTLKLTYENAQQILEGNIPDNCQNEASLFKNMSLELSMKLLYDIAFAMRLKRMQSEAAYAYDINDTGEEKNWQAHLLVEELMIWANNEVAKRIHQSYPEEALLRRQPPPNKSKLQELITDKKSLMKNSPSLTKYLCSEKAFQASSILIPDDVLQKLIEAIQREDFKTLTVYVIANKYYPQLASIESELHSISMQAEYCCTDSDSDPTKYHHDALNLDTYTHFTSPMRRYFDIQVQRMLIDEETQVGNYSHENHHELCILLNKMMHNSKAFEKKAGELELSFDCLSSSRVYTAHVANFNNGYIELQFPNSRLKHFPSRALKFSVSNISLSFRMTSLKILKLIDVLNSQNIRLSLSLPPLQGTTSSERSGQSIGEVATIFAPEDIPKLDETESENDTLLFSKYNAFLEGLSSEVSHSVWRKVLDLVMKPGPSISPEIKSAILQELMEKLPENSELASTGNSERKLLYSDLKFDHLWKPFGVFRTWLSWSMRDHIISPTVQLLELSPSIRFCIQHCTNPAQCYSDPNLCDASKKSYRNINEYVSLWKKVLLAQAAKSSVHDKSSKPFVMSDVTIEWPKLEVPKHCIDEPFFVPDKTVKIVIPEVFIKECFHFVHIRVGDLVCLRCDDGTMDGVKAVFHFVVHHVDNNDDDQNKKGRNVEMDGDVGVHIKHIGDINCRISEEMKKMIDSHKWKYEVQVIPMSVSYRKVFAGLLLLSHSKTPSLSEAVAVNIRKLPQNKLGYPKKASIPNWSRDFMKYSTVELNVWQKKAVEKALTMPFQLIHGPPGTGKSETGAHIAYLFTMLNRLNSAHQCVFYCGPSNKSVDVVLKKFSDLLQRNTQLHQSLNILRIYSSSTEMSDYPYPSGKQSFSAADCPAWARKFALHHLLRLKSNCKENEALDKLRKIEEQIKAIPKEKLPSGRLIKVHKNALNEATEAFLEKNKFDIVFCTCNEASGKRAKLFSVRQCIIDESGMAYEPETIVPLRLCEHAVLIGDHQQLQPVIDYGPAKQCGLSRSLFERYAIHEEYAQYVYTLRTQYRMHEEICKFPSTYFYKNELETDESVKRRTNPETKIEGFWPGGPNKPIAFVNVIGEEDKSTTRITEDSNSTAFESKSNKKEAHKVVEIVTNLHCRHKVPIDQLAILTPYRAQKAEINAIIKKDGPKYLESLFVASITESQGNEFGIVVLSTVRSQPLHMIKNKHVVQPDHVWLRENLGFITDKHQINVGISRSKYGLVIVGNQTLLGYDQTWEALLDHYQQEGCIVDGKSFPY